MICFTLKMNKVLTQTHMNSASATESQYWYFSLEMIINITLSYLCCSSTGDTSANSQTLIHSQSYTLCVALVSVNFVPVLVHTNKYAGVANKFWWTGNSDANSAYWYEEPILQMNQKNIESKSETSPNMFHFKSQFFYVSRLIMYSFIHPCPMFAAAAANR